MKYFIEIRKIKGKGRGVFATKSIAKNQIIEECPIIFIKNSQEKFIQKTVLGKYIYDWKSSNDGAIILGYGSIYNHSYSPNSEYIRDFENDLMIYRSIKNISAGEEISVNYNGDTKDLKPVEDFHPIDER